MCPQARVQLQANGDRKMGYPIGEEFLFANSTLNLFRPRAAWPLLHRNRKQLSGWLSSKPSLRDQNVPSNQDNPFMIHITKRLLSIIVPVYNEEEFVSAAIERAL